MWRWLPYTVVAVVLWSLLTWAGFPLRQCIVLALILSWLVFLVVRAVPKKTTLFSPYWVHIRPKWYTILADYKIINSDKDWEKLQETMYADSLPEAHVFRRGVHFTVLHASSDGERMLICRGPYHFASEVDWIEDLYPARFGLKEVSKFTYRAEVSDVALFLKYGAGGYKLGIRVPEKWWMAAKASCPPPVSEDHDYPCGMVNVALALFPYSEFRVYWDSVEYDPKLQKKILGSVEEQRKKHHWELDQRENPPELSINWPTTIKHRYFDVDHGAV